MKIKIASQFFFSGLLCVAICELEKLIIGAKHAKKPKSIQINLKHY